MLPKNIKSTDIDIELSRRLFEQYCITIDPLFETPTHIKTIIEHLDGVERGEIRRLIISMPPRHGKSHTVSNLFPSWYLGRNPEKYVIQTSYGDELAIDFGRKIKNRIEDDENFRAIFPACVIEKDSRSSSRFHTTKGGSYFAIGRGGAITGRGGHLIIIDDLIKNSQEAQSEATTKEIIDWYSTTLYTRLMPGGAIIIVATRWTEKDLTSYVLELEKKYPNDEKWTEIKLPAISENGLPLWPEKYPLSVLEATRNQIGVNHFSALYQQNPIAGSGNLFTKEMFEYGHVPDTCDYSYITVDTTYTDKQTSDYHAMMHGKIKDGQLYIDKIYRKQIKAEDSERETTNFILSCTQYGFRGAYIEPKGHGIYLNQVLPKKGIVMPSDSVIKEFFKDRRMNKTERANNVLPYLSNRKIIINENIIGKEELVTEIITFPKAKNDDSVDNFIDLIKLVYCKEASIFDVL